MIAQSADAERQRRARARRRKGLVVFKVEADPHKICRALLDAGLLDEQQALRREAVETALAEAIARLCE